jgi:hypothetical protein
MSWRTPKGVRVLEGIEKTLFLIGAAFTYDDMDYNDYTEQEIEQKTVELSSVVEALIEKTEKPPELYAWNESTVASVFDNLKLLVNMELDPGMEDEKPILYKGKLMKEWLLDCNKRYLNNEVEVSEDVEDFEEILDCMAERILWDEDYLFKDRYLDLNPKESTGLKTILGIECDYFVQTGPVESAKTLEKARKYLEKVTRDFEGR